MREIKFRIWDNLKKEWVSNKQIWRMKTDEFGIGEIHPNTFYWKQHPDGLTYQQYTGLKDRYDKEIYEGDIVRAWNQGSSHVGEIRWRLEGAPIIFIYPAYHDGQFWFLHGSKTKDGVYVDCGIEVIGNIFENSELLKQ